MVSTRTQKRKTKTSPPKEPVEQDPETLVLEEFKAEFGASDDEAEAVLSDDASVSCESDNDAGDIVITFHSDEEEDNDSKDSHSDGKDVAAAADSKDSHSDGKDNDAADSKDSAETEQGGEDDSESQSEEESESGQALPLKLDEKTEESIKRKIKQKKSAKSHDANEEKGVVYLGRIPHGFYESQMLSYFQQFGKVTRLRLARNKKTGASKHYGYIEFKNKEVAQIVAETMNGYLIYSHILKCELLEDGKVHESLFKGSGKKFRVVPWNKLERKRNNGPKTEKQLERSRKRSSRNEQKTKEKLTELGIDFDFPEAKKIRV